MLHPFVVTANIEILGGENLFHRKGAAKKMKGIEPL